MFCRPTMKPDLEKLRRSGVISATARETCREMIIPGAKLEDMLQSPQDVEFALAGGELYCLQSRPITAIKDETDVDVDWEAAVDSSYHWEIRPMSMFRGPLYPLQEDAATAYSAGLRTCFDETGRDLPRMCIMQVVEGYAYLRSPEVDAETVSDRQARHTSRCEEYVSRGTTHYKEKIKRCRERL